jgi:hypothetical protein
MYVSQDKRRAVVFTYCIHYEPRNVGGKAFKLRGLDPSLTYKVEELNTDRSAWWGSGNAFTGSFLSSGAFNPVLPQLYSSAVFYLEAD